MSDPEHAWPGQRSIARTPRTERVATLGTPTTPGRYATAKVLSQYAFNQFITVSHSLGPLQVPEGMSLQQFLDIQEMSRGD